MAKKKTLEQRAQRRANQRRTKALAVGVIGLITVLAVAAIGNPWGVLPGKRRLSSSLGPTSAPNPIPSPSNPSKEYIYAGSRMIATEEFASATLSAPGALFATTDSSLPVPRVDINWQPTSGATHYEVERTTNVNTNYVPIASNVTSTTFTDNSVTSVTAYLYRVRAVGAGGSVSPYSNIDVATAISFTDDTLQASSTTVKAEHFNQLRQAVNAVRATTANLGQVTWAEPITAGSTLITAAHVLELRTKLDDALSSLNLPACSYTTASAEVLIQKVHVEQLRQCVK